MLGDGTREGLNQVKTKFIERKALHVKNPSTPVHFLSGPGLHFVYMNICMYFTKYS